MSYCHPKGVFHKDLKVLFLPFQAQIAPHGYIWSCIFHTSVVMSLQLENVLVDNKETLKIIDFGLSILPQHISVRCYMLSTTSDKAYDFSYWFNHVKISRQMDCCIQLVEVLIRYMMLQHYMHSHVFYCI